MRKLPAILIALAVSLSACAKAPRPAPAPSRTAMPAPPADLSVRNCFSSVTAIPHRDLSDREIASIIERQRTQILHKNACGRRLLAWIEDNRKLLGKEN